MKRLICAIAVYQLLFGCLEVQAASMAFGAAPKGNTKDVAQRIIKRNFPLCKQVVKAVRLPDGTIEATCNKNVFRVFTLFDPQQAKLSELALNCTEAEKIGVSCYEK